MELKDPKIKTKIRHSEKNAAWNVVGDSLGQKYKIARVPYLVTTNDKITEINRLEALEHATFISYCFNNSTIILETKQAPCTTY